MWDISDTLNGLMAIPNLIALLLLSGVVVKITREYFDKKESPLAK
jgi:AGCS family alanine or glycine:cation symporter